MKSIIIIIIITNGARTIKPEKIQTRDKIDLWAKVLVSKSDDLVPSPEATWWKEKKCV